MAQTDEIAVITLAFNRINTMHAIINVAEQSRRPDRLYLMVQSPYPPPIVDHAIGIPIQEIQVPGIWPSLWAAKFQAALEAVKEPIAVLMDEDDRFEFPYIEKATAGILQGKCEMACNRVNMDLRRGWIGYDRCSVGTGTLAFRVSTMLQCWRAFVKAGNPMVLREGAYVYPIDGPFYRFIEGDRRMASHDGKRYYFWHSKSQCRRHRKPKFAIDAGP
jgi:hypothetical protein